MLIKSRAFAAACLGAVVGMTAFPGAVLADPPASPEFQLDVAPAPGRGAVLATDAAGNIISVWIVPSVDDPQTAVLYGARNTATGARIGSPFVIDKKVFAYQLFSVAADAAGNFMVVWTHFENGPLLITTLRGRRYDASGAPRGVAFPVATDLVGASNAVVRMNATGEAVVSWTYDFRITHGIGFNSYDTGIHAIHARRFDANGRARGGEIEVRKNPFDDRQYPIGVINTQTVAINALGNFVFAWAESGGMYERRYSADGKSLGDPVLVETVPSFPAIGLDSAGNTLVAWDDRGTLYSRRFDTTGTATGPKTLIHASTGNDFNPGPSVLMNPSGDALIAWTQRIPVDFEITYYGNILAQRLDASGAVSGPIFTANTTTRDTLIGGGIPDGSGGFLLTWSENFTGNLYAARCCTQ